MDASPLFLLVLALSANFLAQSMPCSTRNMLSNTWVKLIVVYALLLFGVVYTGTDKPFQEAVKSSVFPFLLFMLITVCDVQFVLPAIGLLMAAHVFRTELKGGRIRTEDRRRTAQTMVTVCTSAAVITLLVGSGLYYRRQRRDHARNWSWLTFFAFKCRSQRIT